MVSGPVHELNSGPKHKLEIIVAGGALKPKRDFAWPRNPIGSEHHIPECKDVRKVGIVRGFFLSMVPLVEAGRSDDFDQRPEMNVSVDMYKAIIHSKEKRQPGCANRR